MSAPPTTRPSRPTLEHRNRRLTVGIVICCLALAAHIVSSAYRNVQLSRQLDACWQFKGVASGDVP